MSVYTVVVEYAGGTYVDQVDVQDVSLAALAWLERQTDRDLDQWRIIRARARELFATEQMVAISDLPNVWCVHGTIDEELLLANIVKTEVIADRTSKN